MQRPGLRFRRFASARHGLVVLCAGYLLIGTVCFAAGDSPAPAPEAQVADHATEVLLRTIMRQIASGHIISPPEDNAMQTWQRVLQREIASQRSPEVLKALEDFDTYARVRAADETAAGHGLVAAELTVFANQASRMTGRVPPVDQAGTSDTASSETPPGRSGDGTAAPAGGTESETSQAQSTVAVTGATSAGPPAGTTAAGTAAAAGIALPYASAVTVTAAANAANGEVPHARPDGVAATGLATETAPDTIPAIRSAGGIASVTDAVMHIAPQTQTFATTPVAVDTAGGDRSPTRSAGKATDGAVNAVPPAAWAVAPTGAGLPALAAVSTLPPPSAANGEPPQAPAPGAPAGDAARARSADVAAPPQVVATGEAPQAPFAGAAPPTTTVANGETSGPQEATVTAHDGVPSGPLAEAQVPTAPGTRATSVTEAPTTTAPAVTHAAQPGTGNDPATVNGSAVPQQSAPDSAMAAFYAARGDAMLAIRDVSAARKFYEFAANAGSARAAVALARTFDPAFAARLGDVGLRPDPELAAVWYRKAAELGGKPAQLSQSGDTGK